MHIFLNVFVFQYSHYLSSMCLYFSAHINFPQCVCISVLTLTFPFCCCALLFCVYLGTLLNKQTPIKADTTSIVAGAVVIGSLIVGLLVALLISRRRSQREYISAVITAS